MEIAITVLLLIVGLVLIIKGGDFFVDAASWMGGSLRHSEAYCRRNGRQLRDHFAGAACLHLCGA